MQLFEIIMQFTSLFLLFFVYDNSESANILAVIPSPYFSHQATYRPLWRALAKIGHQITLITTDLMEANENITQVDFSEAYEMHKGAKESFVEDFSLLKMIKGFADNIEKMIEFNFGNPKLLELAEKNLKFDLIMVEMVTPFWSALSYKFKAPYIGLTTMEGTSNVHSSVGNAIHPSLYPSTEFGISKPETFPERLKSTMVTVGFTALVKLFTKFFGTPLMRKYLAEDCPELEELDRNISLLIINSNPIFFPNRPVSPVTINLGGGLHIKEPEKLPEELQNFLDQSKDGVIYFSLGSSVNSQFLTPKVVEMFRKTFEELAPMKVLWKFEDDTMENKPKNLEIRKWLPQQDLLGHPNVKLFITQGGLQSMEEAIDKSVPMLGIPFYGDQIPNVDTMVRKKFGLKLDVNNMDKKVLKETILELLKNPIYRKNVEKMSRIQRDKPMKPLEKAVWWTEYVLRHGGTEHLRSPSVDIPLYQYFFLDIIAFVSILLIFVSLITYYSFKVLRFLIKKVYGIFMEIIMGGNKEKLKQN